MTVCLTMRVRSITYPVSHNTVNRKLTPTVHPPSLPRGPTLPPPPLNTPPTPPTPNPAPPLFPSYSFRLALQLGDATLVYTVEDAAGHHVTVQRTVRVADLQPPVITGCPSGPISLVAEPGTSTGLLTLTTADVANLTVTDNDAATLDTSFTGTYPIGETEVFIGSLCTPVVTMCLPSTPLSLVDQETAPETSYMAPICPNLPHQSRCVNGFSPFVRLLTSVI